MSPFNHVTRAEQLLRSFEEAWGVRTEVSKKERGKYKNVSVDQARSRLDALKRRGPHKRGSKEYGEMRELMFVIRSRTGWGKVS